MAGFREPGLRRAGEVSSGGGGGGGGSSAAADITIADAGNYYTSTNVEGALQEAFAAVLLRAKLVDLAATTAGKGASLIGTHDPSLLIGGLHPTVEDSLVSIASDVDTALSETQPILRGGTGQTTAAAAFDALTVTAPALTSAATVDLSLASCPGHYAIVNGATGPITSFGTAPAGTERILRFASTPVVTHNATSLILPGGADITMAAGDLLFLHSLGSGNWRATSYTRAASLPVYATDLAARLTLGATTNVIGNGSAAAPSLTIGTAADKVGFYWSSSAELGIAAAGTRMGRWSSSGLLSDTIYIGPLGSAASPTYTVNGTTGGSGLYGITGGSGGLSLSVLNSDVFTALKSGNAFKFTALVPGANNTASTEFVGFDVALGRTSTWNNGALTTQREALFRKPTYAFSSASTITTAATLAIEGAPVAGTNATITNAYSLWTQAGTVRHDLADAATTTAPDGVVYRHTTSGTAAAGFGLLSAVELQSGAGNVRRVMTDVTKLTTATDAAEVSTRTIQLMNAGALATVATFDPSVTALALSSANASWTTPSLSINSTGGNSVVHFQNSSSLSGGIRAAASGVAWFTSAGSHNMWVGGDYPGGKVAFNLFSNGHAVFQPTAVATAGSVPSDSGSCFEVKGNTLISLPDVTTNAPSEALVLKHVTTSGTVVAGFGVVSAADLQSGAGNVRRVMTDVTSLTVATDTAEVSKRVFNLMTAGALAEAGSFSFEQNLYPMVSVGAIGSGAALRNVTPGSSGYCDLLVGGFPVAVFRRGDNAGSPAICIPQSVSGLYSVTTGVGISAGGSAVAGFAKSASPFVFTAPAPTTANNTASTEFVGFDANMSRTSTWSTGALATQREILLRRPTYAFVGASTITSAATLAIDNAPAAGTNATITNAYALWVQAGAVRFDGNFGFQKAPVAQQSTTGTATGFTAGGGTTVTDASTFTGGTGATAYRISDLVLALKNYGLLAA